MDQLLGEYSNMLAESEMTIWTYDRATQTVTDGNVTLSIGDYVNYDCKTGATTTSYTSPEEKNGYGAQTFTVTDYNYGWRVLGVDDSGQLLLVAEDFVPLTGGYEESGRSYYWLGDEDGDLSLAQAAYVNGVNELNNICAIYGQGTGASGARSITVDDVNKITGYDPDTANYGSGNVYNYGNDVTYTLTSGKVYYQGTKYPTTSTSSSYTSFTYYTGSTWKTLAEGESATLRSTYYWYYPNTLTTSSTGTTTGIETTSTAYKMLFTNSSTGAYADGSGNTDNYWYWLGSSYVGTHAGGAYFGLRGVHDGGVDGRNLYGSSGVCDYGCCGVRPVVSLSSSVSLSDSGTQKDSCTLWNIN